MRALGQKPLFRPLRPSAPPNRLSCDWHLAPSSPPSRRAGIELSREEPIPPSVRKLPAATAAPAAAAARMAENYLPLPPRSHSQRAAAHTAHTEGLLRRDTARGATREARARRRVCLEKTETQLPSAGSLRWRMYCSALPSLNHTVTHLLYKLGVARAHRLQCGVCVKARKAPV